jgi:hypothetical protein
MKYNTYIFRYSTNYNLGLVVINALDLEDAKILALEAGAWDTNGVIVINPSIYGAIITNGDSNY